MDAFEAARLLPMKRQTLEMLKKMRDSAMDRMCNPATEHMKRRARVELNQITTAIAECNDAIFAMEQELDISPEGRPG